jgi:hypothetical protein
MKQFYSLLILMSLSFMISAQCTPDTTLQNTGIFPPAGSIPVGTMIQLPTATVGVAYDEVIQVVIPVDTLIDTLGSSFPATVDSMVITNITGLPPGISFSCDNASCTWEGGTNGCIQLTGTPAVGSSGVYPLSVEVTGYVLLFNIPLSGQDVITDFQILVDPAIGIMEVGRDEIVVYPNPATTMVHWRYPSELSGEVEMHIYNVLGAQVAVKRFHVESGDNILDWDLADLPEGMYMYEVNGQKGQFLIHGR